MTKKDKERVKDLISLFDEKKAKVKELSEFREEYIVARRTAYTEVIKELKNFLKES